MIRILLQKSYDFCKKRIRIPSMFHRHAEKEGRSFTHPLNLPTGITIWQYTGFLGHNPENVQVKMPEKKLRLSTMLRYGGRLIIF